MAGVVYKLDVLQWVPWAGVYAGYLGFLEQPRSDLNFKQHDVAVGLGAGLDYAFSRKFGLGVTLRSDYALSHSAPTPSTRSCGPSTDGAGRRAPAHFGTRRVAAVAICGCQSQPDGPLKATPSLLRSASAAASAKASEPAPLGPPPPWAEALRSQRYKEAERAFSALPADAQHGAEVRFAWAKTRLELGQAALALPLLTGLEQSLPVLSAQVGELRGQVLLVAGPPADAAKLLEARGDAQSLASAAKAWLEAGDAEHAIKVAERGLASLGKGRGAREREVWLRHARGLAAEKLGKQPLWAG